MSSVDFINENINWRDITPGGEVYEGGSEQATGELQFLNL